MGKFLVGKFASEGSTCDPDWATWEEEEDALRDVRRRIGEYMDDQNSEFRGDSEEFIALGCTWADWKCWNESAEYGCGGVICAKQPKED